MKRPPLSTRRRKGFLLQEAVMAILIMTLVLVAAAKLLQLVTSHQRVMEYRNVATLELANVMEDLLGRNWNDVATEMPHVELSPYSRAVLPAPELRLQISTPAGDADARRIRVELDWQATDARRTVPLQLVVWRYAPTESQP